MHSRPVGFGRRLQVTLLGAGAVLLLLFPAVKPASAAEECPETEDEECCQRAPAQCGGPTLLSKSCSVGPHGACIEQCTWHCTS